MRQKLKVESEMTVEGCLGEPDRGAETLDRQHKWETWQSRSLRYHLSFRLRTLCKDLGGELCGQKLKVESEMTVKGCLGEPDRGAETLEGSFRLRTLCKALR